MKGGRLVSVVTRRMSPQGSRPLYRIPTLRRSVVPHNNNMTTPICSRHAYCPFAITRREFQNEAAFHKVADETLDDIQDAMEEVFEQLGDTDEELEVSVASGVLTLALPPHGTWVMNKQTPNRQIWWSSPISGPRRYEYEDDRWVYTRSIDEEKNQDSDHMPTLGAALREEIKQLYGIDMYIDV